MDSLKKLLAAMQANGATKFYAKKLSPNDNSKNQVYLGEGFNAINLLPFGTVEIDTKLRAGSKRDRAKAGLVFYWIDEDGLHHAPEAKLIFYPEYPEVRMSGFLLRARQAPSAIMRCRDEGRTLFLGVSPDGRIFGRAAWFDSPLRRELDAMGNPSQIDVFIELSADATASGDNRGQLLAELLRIHRKSWIPSQRLSAKGLMPYTARNGGGYTLEAELGISPNGYSEPDFLGWEVKQYGVNNFTAYLPQNPVTLMTPEPTGGSYKTDGFEFFMRRFGYADKSGKEDRFNFGGVYKVGALPHLDTKVELQLLGFDKDKKLITDITQGIALVATDGTIAAIWHYAGLLEHWNRKHAKTVYVPSLKREPPIEYSYGGFVELCVGTDFDLFIKAIAAGAVYFDPGMKLENMHLARPSPKKRSQFRVRHNQLRDLYSSIERIELG